MSRAYSDIAFTPAVRAMQTRMGSRASYAAFDQAEDRQERIGPREAEFITARDSFYQARVSETGWPYVQYRGGPPGFLKVLDDKTLGYADFRGNVQYISVGNFASNDPVSIILMDYPNRARLKILGRVRLVGCDEDQGLIAKLESPHYRARVERGVIITVEGYDWNCPQHITPRFTEAEIAAATASLREELAELKARLAQFDAATSAAVRADPPASLGKGPLALVVTSIRQLTPRVRGYELRAADGATLPVVAPGAHIDVPVRVTSRASEVDSTRRYSITAVSPQGDSYEIAVQREDAGRGGSLAVHRDYRLGMTLRCGMPGNDFELHTDDRPAVLIAGGIGITPIHAMAQASARQGRNVTLHYAARAYREAALAQPLQDALGDAMTLYLGEAGKRFDAPSAIASAPANSVFYVCGPSALIESVRAAARERGISEERVRFERFAAAPVSVADRPIRVTLRRSGKIVEVSPSQAILDAVQAAGVDAPAACRAGTCGTCAVKVLAGEPDHRDMTLSVAEREQAGLMCICVSRAKSPGLTLDL
jgi:ferredoxin-NADP reductase/predicted pyridoxine 5'-phosphate oxidase superfamily flavin-nucleotide-binding protein